MTNLQKTPEIPTQCHALELTQNQIVKYPTMHLNELSQYISSGQTLPDFPMYKSRQFVMTRNTEDFQVSQINENNVQAYSFQDHNHSRRFMLSGAQNARYIPKGVKRIQESGGSLDEYLKQKIHQQMVMNSSDDPSSSKPYSKDTKENLPNKESEDRAKKPTRKRRSSSAKPCSKGHFCTCDLSEDDAYKVNTILKKKNLHFMLGLTMFNYEIREKQTPVTGRRTFEFICKHNGCCNIVFERSWNLLDHWRMHYNIKPFLCRECGKWFTQRGNLRKHMTIHKKSK